MQLEYQSHGIGYINLILSIGAVVLLVLSNVHLLLVDVWGLPRAAAYTNIPSAAVVFVLTGA